MSQINFQIESLSQTNPIKTGKEAAVYYYFDEKSNKELAVKFYTDNRNYSYNLYNPYLENIRINKKYRRMVSLRTYRSKQFLTGFRTKREFMVMQRNYKTNPDLAQIPQVYRHGENWILMDFIGENQKPASRLDQVNLTESENQEAFLQILNRVWDFYQNGLIHSDLSAFNILWWQNKAWIIDFPQTVDVIKNPNWKKFLKRDLENLKKYFVKNLKVEKFEKYKVLWQICNIETLEN